MTILTAALFRIALKVKTSNSAQIVKSEGFKFGFFGLFLLTYGGPFSTVVFVLRRSIFTVPRMVLLEKNEGVYISGSKKEPKENIVDKGKVKWFNERKGFGFIVPDDGGKDLFVHHSNISAEGFRSLSDGQDVEFEVSQGEKGPEATNVSPC